MCEKRNFIPGAFFIGRPTWAARVKTFEQVPAVAVGKDCGALFVAIRTRERFPVSISRTLATLFHQPFQGQTLAGLIKLDAKIAHQNCTLDSLDNLTARSSPRCVSRFAPAAQKPERS